MLAIRGIAWGGAPRKTATRLSALGGLLFGLGVACGAGDAARPDVHAAASLAAEREVRHLEQEWEVSSPTQRLALRADLERFLVEHPGDPSTARARVMLAEIALVGGRLDDVDELLRSVISGSEGQTRDLALLLAGAVNNRRGEHARALARLEPLSGKLLSEEARQMHGLELTTALVAERRHADALDAMVTWIAGSGRLAEGARRYARESLASFPDEALMAQLREWKTRPAPRAQALARDHVQRAIIQHLTMRALERKDETLARDLLAAAPSWLRATEEGEQLSVLALAARGEARVVGRAVGVVVGGTSEAAATRSSRVALGMMRGLSGSGVELLVEEARGSMPAALGGLSGLGATVLVGGVDELSAGEAMTFAESRKVAVVTFARPERFEGADYGFVFSQGEARERGLLEATLGPNEASGVALLGTEQVPCPTAPGRPGVQLPFFVDANERALAVLVLGSTACAELALTQLDAFRGDAARPTPPLLLGLAASATTPNAARTREVRYLGAGKFPLPAPARASERSGEEDTALVSGESWYEALGEDLGKLLAVALADQPTVDAENPGEVRARHDRARDALERAEAELVTTGARGFSGKHELLREVVVHRVPPRASKGTAR